MTRPTTDNNKFGRVVYIGEETDHPGIELEVTFSPILFTDDRRIERLMDYLQYHLAVWGAKQMNRAEREAQ